jgi:signal transduction histidine kinase
MGRLIKDLLDFARAQTGSLSIEREQLDLSTVIHESLEMLEPVIAEKQLRLDSEVADELEVHGDRNRLRQILANLIGNALKFTPAGGSITVRAERTGTEGVVTVSDTGPGIATETSPTSGTGTGRVTEAGAASGSVCRSRRVSSKRTVGGSGSTASSV